MILLNILLPLVAPKKGKKSRICILKRIVFMLLMTSYLVAIQSRTSTVSFESVKESRPKFR